MVSITSNPKLVPLKTILSQVVGKCLATVLYALLRTPVSDAKAVHGRLAKSCEGPFIRLGAWEEITNRLLGGRG